MNILNLDKNGKNAPVKIFKNDKGKYLVGISRKIGEEYKNKYFPVEFLKGVELDNETEIIIKNAFISWYDWTFEDKQGTTFVIKITAFDKPGETKQEVTPQNIDKWSAGKDIEIEPDDLPFY